MTLKSSKSNVLDVQLSWTSSIADYSYQGKIGIPNILHCEWEYVAKCTQYSGITSNVRVNMAGKDKQIWEQLCIDFRIHK